MGLPRPQSWSGLPGPPPVQSGRAAWSAVLCRTEKRGQRFDGSGSREALRVLSRDSSSCWAEAGRPRQQAGQGGEPSERGRAPGPPGQSGILGELTVHPGLISHPTSSRSCVTQCAPQKPARLTLLPDTVLPLISSSPPADVVTRDAASNTGRTAKLFLPVHPGFPAQEGRGAWRGAAVRPRRVRQDSATGG